MIETKDLANVVVARKSDSVLEVSRILRDTRSRHLVVIDDQDKPVGIISTVDVNNRVVAEEKDPLKNTAEQIMTKDIEAVDFNNDYKNAFQIMIKRSTYSIPVTRQGKLLGLLEFTTCMHKLNQEQQPKKEQK